MFVRFCFGVCNLQLLPVTCTATSLEAAAGMLITSFGGDRGLCDFKELHRILEDPEWVKRAGSDAVTKLFMVVDGSYKGFPLLNKGSVWRVGHKTANHIWTAYDSKLLPAELLLKRFGHAIHCIDCWKRTPGHGAQHKNRGANRKKGPAHTPANPNSKRGKAQAASGGGGSAAAPKAAPAKAAAPSAPGMWICKACTYENKATANACDMCNTKK